MSRPLAAARSGIGFDELEKEAKKNSVHTKYITSRTARVFLAGAGFLADAYDLFVINLVLRLLRDEYSHYATSGQIHVLEGAVASAALFGAIIGQIGAGYLADIVGRKKIFIATAILIILGCIGGSMTVDSDMFSIYAQIACWRALLGMGVGGEYPLAATVTSESSSAGKRGTLMAAVFAMQGVAFGSVPVLIAFPWRMKMHETESFERIKESRKSGNSHRSEFGW
eukprot:gene42317-56221_t